MNSETQAEIRNLSATEGRITSAIIDPAFLSDLFCVSFPTHRLQNIPET